MEKMASLSSHYGWADTDEEETAPAAAAVLCAVNDLHQVHRTVGVAMLPSV